MAQGPVPASAIRAISAALNAFEAWSFGRCMRTMDAAYLNHVTAPEEDEPEGEMTPDLFMTMFGDRND